MPIGFAIYDIAYRAREMAQVALARRIFRISVAAPRDRLEFVSEKKGRPS
jgi:hypothetical protein